MFTGSTIIFDLDGTLVDTAPDLINALNFVMAHEGLGTVPESLIRPQISLGARNMIRTGLDYHGRASNDRADQLFDMFIEFYRANIAKDSKPFEGMTAALEQLKDNGARLGVCTNKTQEMAVQLIDDLGFSRLFGAIAGRDRFDCYKPDPNHLLKTIALTGGSADRAVMVGDSPTDINTAIAAALPSVAVTFGYCDIPVTELGATALIGHYDELVPALNTILDAKC